jgi:hypothetical protein
MFEFMDRMFLPVGQGAFYCERFKCSCSDRTMNFVYDCGVLLRDCGSPDVKLKWLENVIDSVFREGETIDAVFISHLHEDHISGLRHLARRCSIRKIYLPSLDQESRLLMLLNYVTKNLKSTNCNNDGMDDLTGQVLASDDLSGNLQRQLNADAQVIPVREHGDSNEGAKGLELRGSGLFKENVEGLFSDWKYKLFCIKDDNAVRKVRTDLLAVARKYLDGKVDGDFPEVVAELVRRVCNHDNTHRQDIVDEICKVYQDTIGGAHFNTHSLVVYSGCDNSNGALNVKMCCPLFVTCLPNGCINLPPYRSPYCFPYSSNKVGCLYTGDFNAKDYWSDLHDSKCKQEWNTIGCVQIPHHGSNGSYHDDFLEMEAWHVISAGLGNKYKHPSLGVLERYYNGKKPFPIVVTQEPRSIAGWHIYPKKHG